MLWRRKTCNVCNVHKIVFLWKSCLLMYMLAVGRVLLFNSKCIKVWYVITLKGCLVLSSVRSLIQMQLKWFYLIYPGDQLIAHSSIPIDNQRIKCNSESFILFPLHPLSRSKVHTRNNWIWKLNETVFDLTLLWFCLDIMLQR